MKTPLLLSLSIVLLSLPAPSQSIELATGETLVGLVVAFDGDGLTFQEGFPGNALRRLEAAQLAPRSWLSLLTEKTAPDDVEAQLRLAQLAETAGLPGQAIAAWRRVAAAAPDRSEEATRQVLRLREQVAAELLAETQERIGASEWAAAKLQLQVIAGDYADTKAAAAATALLPRVLRELSIAKKRERVAESRAEAALARAAALLEKSEKAMIATASARIRDQRREETRLAHLEEALAEIDAIAAPQPGSPLEERLDTLRTDLRRRLLGAYIDLGTIHLKRRSLSQAEAYNVKACSLDPKSGGCAALQGLIIQARITDGR